MFTKLMFWVALISVLLLQSCSSTRPEPERPSKVPKEAVWAGGADGGSYIQCTYDMMLSILSGNEDTRA
jgi:hypothetical protein